MKGEMNHERLWTLKNNLRVLKVWGMGGWVSLVVGIMEDTYCMEHWVWCINKESWNTEKIKFKKKKKEKIYKYVSTYIKKHTGRIIK